jgi:tetratricopeptide (TPR) repeat protein
VTAMVRGRSVAAIDPVTPVQAARPNDQAYIRYLQGRYLIARRNEESLRKAVSKFEEAVRLDEGFAPAYVGAANALGLMGFYGWVSPNDSLARGYQFIEKAMALDPKSSEALTSFACWKLYYHHDWADAEARFRQALELNPTSSSAHQWYAEYLMAMNQMDQAKGELALAIDLDPLSLITNTVRGLPDYYLGNLDASIRQYMFTLELDSTFLPAQLWLGRALTQKGNYGKAIATLERASALSNKAPVIRAALGHAYAKAGDKEQAMRIYNELVAVSKRSYVSSYDLAGIKAGLGHTEAALDHLEAARQERAFYLIFAGVDPVFSSLRSQPRFASLLKNLKLPTSGLKPSR